jgi:hypothetical protein
MWPISSQKQKHKHDEDSRRQRGLAAAMEAGD